MNYETKYMFPMAKRREFAIAVCARHGCLVVEKMRLDTICSKCSGEITPEAQALAIATIVDVLVELRNGDAYGVAVVDLAEKALKAVCQL